MIEPPVGHSERDVLYFADGTLAYAGRYFHHRSHPVHTHSFFEIVFIVGGQGSHYSLAGRQRLEVGDVILLRPGVWHGYENCRRLQLYNCCFSTDLLARELAWTREDPMLGFLLWTGPLSMRRRGMLTTSLGPEALRACVEQLDELNRLWFEPLSHYRGELVGRLSVVLGKLARAVVGDHAGLVQPTGPTHPAVIEAIHLLEARLAHPWSLGELADALHLTRIYLGRIFKLATGLPPMAYLARRRVETAAALLLDTGEPVTQIARAVGWPDPNYFARRFKAHFGLSATAYRGRFANNRMELRTSPNHHGPAPATPPLPEAVAEAVPEAAGSDDLSWPAPAGISARGR